MSLLVKAIPGLILIIVKIPLAGGQTRYLACYNLNAFGRGRRKIFVYSVVCARTAIKAGLATPMLILTRRVGQAIIINPQGNVELNTPVGAFSWPLRIVLTRIEGQQAKIGLDADPRFLILREEIEHGSASQRELETGIKTVKKTTESLEAALRALHAAKDLIVDGDQKEFLTQVQRARRAIIAIETSGLLKRKSANEPTEN